jgi:hypothetical protein
MHNSLFISVLLPHRRERRVQLPPRPRDAGRAQDRVSQVRNVEQLGATLPQERRRERRSRSKAKEEMKREFRKQYYR